MCQIDVLDGKSIIIDFLDDFLKKRTAILNYLNRIFFHTFLKIFHSMEKAAKGTEYSKNHQKNSVNNRLELGI